MKWPALLALLCGTALASPPTLSGRRVHQLDAAATRQAHQRDPTATRAHAGVRIKTWRGFCLAVDPRSGDARANLTPVRARPCRKTRRQRWDVVTAGRHVDRAGHALVVSAETQACLDVDRRLPAAASVSLFSCGGRADGSGNVTDSQFFVYDGAGVGAASLQLRSRGWPGFCLVDGGKRLGVGVCGERVAAQRFSFAAFP